MDYTSILEKWSPEKRALLAQRLGLSSPISHLTAGGTGPERLTAYVVLATEQEPTEAELRIFLSKRLPDYMVPSRFVTLDTLPQTPTGKVDGQGLRDLELPQADLSTSTDTPQNPLEEALCKIWADVLGLERVGPKDDFFSLGGQSLLVMQLVFAVNEALHITLPVRAVFDAPTVAGLVTYLDQQPTSRETSEEKICKRKMGEVVPLSYAQQRLWVLQQLDPQSPAYNISVRVRLSGRLNLATLGRAVDEVVRRHEILRTTFDVIDDYPAQIIAPPPTQSLSVEDLTHLPKREQEAHEDRMVHEDAKKPFSLSNGPLLRATLLRFDEQAHTLLLTMHHVISDAHSFSVFFRELSVAYQALLDGEKPTLDDPIIQYGDYACWERAQTDKQEAQLNYWKSKLSGAVPQVLLPIAQSSQTEPTSRGEAQMWEISAELSGRLRRFSKEHGTTLFMTLVAAFKVLLHRYSNQDDILLGTTVARRHRKESWESIGFFQNTLVLRTDVSGAPTFSETLQRVKEVVLEAFAHQDIPFEKLVQELGPERDVSGHPFFQIFFAYQSGSDEETWRSTLQLPNVAARASVTHNATAKFALTMIVEERGDRLGALVEHRSDLVSSETIERMLGHFEILLEAIVSDPNLSIKRLPLLTETEQHQLLVEWNDTTTEYPRDTCIHKLFEEQAGRFPDEVAVESQDAKLTYNDLNKRSNRVAHHLQTLGVGPDKLVGIYMARSVECIVGLLAILKAGGAYLPLSTTYPKERLAYMINDAGLDVVLTTENLRSELPDHQAQVVCLDNDANKWMPYSQENPAHEVQADQLAYVSYTSGSTGTPKGVEVPHRGVIRLIFGADYVQLGPRQRFLQHSTLSFDASTFEIWGALLHGGTCVLLPDHHLSLQVFGRTLREHKVNTLWVTSALYNSIIDEAPNILEGVEQLLIGGESLSVEHIWRGLKRFPQTRFINGYGPTESTTFTCCYRIPPELDRNLSSIPIGRPIGNTQVYLLNDTGQPVPVGVTGELHIGGDGLARGYLHHPDLTEEKFVPNPFRKEPGARLYRSGDMARFRPDGEIEFIGRTDDQVKLRGHRIELGEIECVLRQHRDIKEVVVIAPKSAGTADEKSLVAYVVAEQETILTKNELQDFLKAKIPKYMLPSTFVILDEFPVNDIGKVDRLALPEAESPRTDPQKPLLPPQTSLEKVVAKVWSRVLSTDLIGVQADFFEIGGHSLSATRVMARLHDVFRLDLPLRTFFEAPTVMSQAHAIAEAWGSTEEVEQVAQTFLELDGLSSEEVQGLLAQEEAHEEQSP